MLQNQNLKNLLKYKLTTKTYKIKTPKSKKSQKKKNYLKSFPSCSNASSKLMTSFSACFRNASIAGFKSSA